MPKEKSPLRLSDFDYDLPEELIAQHPNPERDRSRMMILDRNSGGIRHASFDRLAEFIEPETCLVLNDSRVIPARVWGKAGDRDIEFLFLKETEPGIWEVLCRPARKVKPGVRIVFSKTLDAEVHASGPEGRRFLRFSSGGVLSELQKIGFAPLPPYIKRKKEQIDLRLPDLERYQTVYAQKPGSIAAPTAGLHFTPDTLAELEGKGCEIVRISLDVGLATFQPVRVDLVIEHKMLTESYAISEEAAERINRARTASRPVMAVGTTTVRTLESASRDGRVIPGTNSTDLFIYPGFKFQTVDRLLTNFHLPKSTLLMLVSALAGKDSILRAYKEAVQERYRFFSYGDCMLIR